MAFAFLLSCFVCFQAFVEDVHCFSQCVDVEYVGQTNLAQVVFAVFVEACSGSHHEGFAVNIEFFKQPAAEVFGIVDGQVGYGVEGAAGHVAFYAVDFVEFFDNDVATFLIDFGDLIQVGIVDFIEGCGTDHVHGGASQAAGGQFVGGGDEVFVHAGQVTDTGAASAEAFGDGVLKDQAILDAFDGTEAVEFLAVEDEFAVKFFSDDPKVVFDGDVCDQFDFLLGVNGTGGVAGVGQEDGFGFVGDFGFDDFSRGEVEVVFDDGGEGGYRGRGFDEVGVVVGVVGFAGEDFIAYIGDCEQGEKKGFGAACGNDDVVSGHGDVSALVVFCHAFAKFGKTRRGCIA